MRAACRLAVGAALLTTLVTTFVAAALTRLLLSTALLLLTGLLPAAAVLLARTRIRLRREKFHAAVIACRIRVDLAADSRRNSSHLVTRACRRGRGRPTPGRPGRRAPSRPRRRTHCGSRPT